MPNCLYIYVTKRQQNQQEHDTTYWSRRCGRQVLHHECVLVEQVISQHAVSGQENSSPNR